MNSSFAGTLKPSHLKLLLFYGIGLLNAAYAASSGASSTVQYVTVGKAIQFVQTSATNAQVDPTPPGPAYGGAYGFSANVSGINISSIAAPVVTGPMYAPPSFLNGGTLLYSSPDDSWRLGYPNANDWGSPTLSDLNANFGSGVYTFSVNGSTVPLALTGDDYPNNPIVKLSGGSWSGGKYLVNVGHDLTITTSSFTAYGTHPDDHIGVFVDGITSFDQFHSTTPGTNYVSITIPANALTAGQDYSGSAEFDALVDVNPSALPGSLNAAFYAKSTDFTISAVSTPVSGNSALLWQNTNGAQALWLMNGTTQQSAAEFGPYTGWSVVSGDGDYNGDGKSDLLWTNTNGAAALWLMNGTTQQSAAVFGPYPGWSIVSGNHDFNGDGKSDLLWQNTNGSYAIWLMNGTTQQSAAVFGPYPGWSIVSGNNDFNGDGKSDLLWTNTNGAAALWLMNGTTQLSAAQLGPYPGWSIVSGGSDYNGDGKSDLLWQNTNGSVALWLMNGTTQLSAAVFGPYPGWSVVAGRRDFNGDGKSDLLWTNTNGAAALWLMNGTTQLSAAQLGPYPGWSITSGIGDYNGDGMTDLLWHNTDGSAALWLMNGTTQQSAASFGPYPGWSVVTGTTGP